MSPLSGPARQRDSFRAVQDRWDLQLSVGLRPTMIQQGQPAAGAVLAHRDRHSRNSARRGARTGRGTGRYAGFLTDSTRRVEHQHDRAGT